MKCRRCGRENSSNAGKCMYCNTPLYGNYRNVNMQRNKRDVNGAKKKNDIKTDNTILALIIALIIIFAAMVGIYAFQSFTPRKKGFGGGGGGSLPPPAFSTSDGTTSQTPEDKPNDEVGEKPEEKEIPAEQPSKSSERTTQKDAFLDKASDIEQYSKTYLETAENQAKINSESWIVYKKWDSLLNEVYQYLKTIMSDSEFKQLQKDEIAWIAKKEKAIEEAGAEWEGGSGEPMARNMTGIQYTRERCYYLISLIN